MATRIVNNRDVTNTSALTFIRPMNVSLNISDVRPSTILYVFFDGIPVNRYVTPEGGQLGDSLISNSAGKAVATLSIPGNTFNTGAREIRVQDNPLYNYAAISGSSVSEAKATFYTSGVKNTFQETLTQITEEVVNIEDITWVDVEVPPDVINIPVPVIQEVYVPQEPVNIILNPNVIVRPGAAVDITPVPTPPAPPPASTVVNSVREIARQPLSLLGINLTNVNISPGFEIDPLAQSFFTYGVDGGCFVTKIDIFFQAKDTTVPVILELREMINGFPGPDLIAPGARVSLAPEFVNTSDNASLPTSFVFSRPIYLKQDSEFCFVVLANSKSYNLWTSRMGEVSTETGATIFEQPYSGSLFKSENNITWTPEQFEDIKFTMFKAAFDTTKETNLVLVGNLSRNEIKGSQLYSIAGSNVIRYYAGYQHASEVDSKIVLESQPDGLYNGIPSEELSGTFNITRIVDDYTLEFSIGVNATSSGPLSSPGYITAVYLDNPGTGYSNPPTVSFTGGGGSGASATTEVYQGGVFRINLTNRGSDYTSDPLIILSGSGSGAQAVATTESTFYISTNRRAHIVKPLISNFVPEGTAIQSTLRMTTGNYSGANLNSYSLRGEEEVRLNESHDLGINTWTVSRQNEFSKMTNSSSTRMNILMATSNPNVSPVLDFGVSAPALHCTAFNINNQDNEETFENSFTATPDAVIRKLQVTAGGTGYVSGANRPTVFVTGGGGSGAQGLARVGGIAAIEITNQGSGYTSPPDVVITGTGTNASAAALIQNGRVYKIIPFDSGDDYTSASISFVGGGGVGATATAIIASPSEITQIRLVNPGSGYTSTPEVTIVDPRAMSPGSGATAQAIISKFNTERKATGGNAYAKYVSKVFSLATPSTGSRLYASIYSPSTGSVDVYIRTSLASSGVIHKELTWKQMKGDAPRNLSSRKGQFLDYSFLFDNLQEYDLFDIKIVLRSTDPSNPPSVKNYRFIATA